MSKSQTIGSIPSNVLGMLGDLMVKLQKGSTTPKELELFLKRQNPFAITNIREEWQEFYRKYFRLSVDFTDVTIPDNPSDFGRVVFIPQGLTYADIVKVLKKKFKVYLYTENLDKDIKDDVRTSNQSYAIRLRERVEADQEMKSLSANDLKAKSVNCITLMERLILELKYFDETGKHLDISNVTLCAGSRVFGGVVPVVGWGGVELRVYWYFPDRAVGGLRARVAVSA